MLFCPFAVQINCSSDPKRFSWSQKQFFLIEGQNNIGKNIQIFIFPKNFQIKFLILDYWEKGDGTFAMTYKSICRFLEKFHDAQNQVTLHVGLGSCLNLFGESGMGKNFRILPFGYWSITPHCWGHQVQKVDTEARSNSVSTFWTWLPQQWEVQQKVALKSKFL